MTSVAVATEATVDWGRAVAFPLAVAEDEDDSVAAFALFLALFGVAALPSPDAVAILFVLTFPATATGNDEGKL